MKKLILTFAALCAWSASSSLLTAQESASANFTEGAFIVNEEQYGSRNSTVNFLGKDGIWTYEPIRNTGGTACFGTVYGGRIYIVAKTAKDPGADASGGRLSVYDATSMELVGRIEELDPECVNMQGSAFLGVDTQKGYVSTSAGIYTLDLNTLEITGHVTATNGKSFGSLCGNMVRTADSVYAVVQGQGIAAIDPATDETVHFYEGNYCSLTLSKDGTLWASKEGGLVHIVPATGAVTELQLPEGMDAPNTSPWAWTPDGLCASTQHNAIFWTHATGWNGSEYVYKYDIDRRSFSTLVDLTEDTDGWRIYGCSFRVDPVTDEAVVSLFKGYGSTEYTVRRYDADGRLTADCPMNDAGYQRYWFPGIIFFPDNAEPVFELPTCYDLTADGMAVVNLKEAVSDADNLSVSIATRIVSVTPADVLDATIEDGLLVIKPQREGRAEVTIEANSNGRLNTATLPVNVTNATGIGNIQTGGRAASERYSADGRKARPADKGVQLIRLDNGRVCKVLVR